MDDVAPIRRRQEPHARIGIHSGAVVAGVIGTDRCGYDLWDDTVNVASRLESTGEVDPMHISVKTKSRLTGEFQNRHPVETSLVL